MHKIISLSIISLLLLSCGNGHTSATDSHPKVSAVTENQAQPKKDLKNFVLDSKKDLSCGMPISAGLEDTAHYRGKLYGFCSKECKDAFLKNPTAYLK